MSQPTSSAGLGVPLSSNNKANPYRSLGGSGGQLAGVEALNGISGIVDIVGDSSIGISNIGSGQLQVSTAGKAQAVGAVSCTTLTASGAVSGATVSSAGTVSASGAVSGSTFTNSSTNTPVAMNIASATTYNAGLSASLATVLPAAVAGLANFKVLRLTVSSLQIGYGAPGGNTYWFAISAGGSTTQGNANIIRAQSVQFMQTLVNAGDTTYTYAIDLPYTAATWPTNGLMFFINASAGGTLSMTASISGVV
jgi:hypothetical protein